MRNVLSGDRTHLPYVVNRNVVTVSCQEVQEQGARKHPDVLEDERQQRMTLTAIQAFL